MRRIPAFCRISTLAAVAAAGTALALADPPREAAPSLRRGHDLTLRLEKESVQTYRQSIMVKVGATPSLNKAQGVMFTTPLEDGLFLMSSRTLEGISIDERGSFRHALQPSAFRTVNKHGIAVAVGNPTPAEWRAVLMSTLYRPEGRVQLGNEWTWLEPANKERGTGEVFGRYRLVDLVESREGDLAQVEFLIREEGEVNCSSQGTAWICIHTGALIRMTAAFNATPTREGLAIGYRAALTQSHLEEVEPGRGKDEVKTPVKPVVKSPAKPVKPDPEPANPPAGRQP